MATSAILRHRRDTAANWTANDPVLEDGQQGFETDTLKSKLGDGVTAWTALAYASGPGGSGTVTSVAISGTDGIEVDSGSPVTTAGTIQLGLDATVLGQLADAATAVQPGDNVSDLTNDAGYATGGGTASGTNTGDQTSIVGITGTLAEFNTALTGADFATGGGTATGTNTGDQTSIVGITGTLAEFNTALTGADFATGGGTATGTNTGDQTITLTGDVTGSGTGSFAATIANDAVTYAKMQNVSATNMLLGRSTAGAGDVEEIPCTANARNVLASAALRPDSLIAATADRISDFDGQLGTAPGFIAATSSATTGPAAIALAGLAMPFSSTAQVQLAARLTSSASVMDVWMRSSNASTWSAWQRVGLTGTANAWTETNTFVTQTISDNSTKAATTAYVDRAAATIVQNSQSAAYTLVLTDAGKHIFHPSADTTARIWTIPANSSVAFPVGTAVTFVNQNAAGVITIDITTDTMRLAGAGTTGSRTLAANGIATALKVTTTEWIISGTGLT